MEKFKNRRMDKIKYEDFVTREEILTVPFHGLPERGDRFDINGVRYYVDGSKRFDYDKNEVVIMLRQY